ncbi:MAG: hypothetical protein ACRELY_05375 [Polyangiaceae bacterium]
MLRRLCALSWVAILLAIAACSTASQGAGTKCTSDSDCSTGACLPFAVFDADSGACTDVAKACSKTCNGDSDCASLGANFKCFQACNGGPQTCGAT